MFYVIDTAIIGNAGSDCNLMVSDKELKMTSITDTFSEMPLLMKVTQVAELLGVSPSTIYRLADAGDLEKVEISLTTSGKTIRITNESVQKLIERWMKNAS
jgi:excisionase family DNA binding protein